MKKQFKKELKNDLIILSSGWNNTPRNIEELGVGVALNCVNQKEFEEFEFENFFKLSKPIIKDLEYENSCLQKLIKDAKVEQALLKKAINAFYVRNSSIAKQIKV